jgi:hypothetical protein
MNHVNTDIYELNFEKLKKSKKYKNIALIKVFICLFFLINLIIVNFLFYKRKNNNNTSKSLKYDIKNNLNEIIKLKNITNHLKIEMKLMKEKQNLLFTLRKYDIITKNLKTKNKTDLINLFQPKDVIGKGKIRIGRKYDGGYVILNDFKNVKIAYSFGISREISFDKGLADKNIDVFMYDHTISKLPYENHRFHWKKIGLASEKVKEKNMKTLDELIRENNHSNEKNMILKIDIEASEWNIFQNLSISTLKQFKQIVGEFHFNDKNKLIYLDILKKIQITHQIIHLHCNNCRYNIINIEGYYLCPLLEITLIQRELYSFKNFQNTFPINGLDFRNCEKKQELDFLLNNFIH